MSPRPTEGTIPGSRRRANSSASNLTLVFKVAPEDSLGQLVTEWTAACRANGLSAKTITDYEKNVNKFWWWWASHTGYAERYGAHPQFVTTKLAREYALYLRTPSAFRWGEEVRNGKHTLSPVSVASYGRDLKVFFNWLEAEGYIEQTPFNKSVKFSAPHRDQKLIRVVEPDDQRRLLLYLLDEKKLGYFTGRRDLAIIALLLDTGVRKGELLNLRDEDLYLKKNMCLVHGKTGERYVHFSEGCREALQNYLKSRDEVEGDYPSLWITDTNKPLGPAAFSSIIRRLKKFTGVDFHAHKLRHTFATTLANEGLGIGDLSKLLGHSKISTTQIYVHQDGQNLGETYRPLSPLGKLQEVSAQLKRRPGRPRRER